MSISNLTFGSPVYDPPFSVSSGDTGVIKLRSRETAPLSHESLDENFTNLSNKINEILGQHIDKITITDIAQAPEPSRYVIDADSLGINNGDGITYSSSTGVIAHQARPTAAVGYYTANIDAQSLRFINGLDFDSFGHISGYKTGTMTFTTSGHLSASVGGNAVTLSSSAYGYADSPYFNNVDVNGNITGYTYGFRSDSPNRWYHFDHFTGGNFIGRGNQDYTSLYDASELSMVWKAGNVGIGTTSPGETLTVAKESNPRLLISNSGSTSGTSSILFGDSSSDESGRIIYAHANNSLSFYTYQAERLTIDGVGNVGIGNTSPISPLHVSSSSAQTISLTTKTDISGIAGGAASKIEGGALVGTGPSMGAAIGLCLLDSDGSDAGTNTEGYLYFETKNSGAGLTEKMRITSAGNVGIGTTSPGRNLEVKGEATFINNDSEVLISNTADHCRIYSRINSTNLEKDLGIYTGVTERMRIAANGNVGIGTTSPEGMLEIFHGAGSWDNPGLHIKGNYPTIKFNDTDTNAPDWYIHQSGQSFYILADRDASGEDSPISEAGNVWENPLPFHLNCVTNVLEVFGNEVITEDNISSYITSGGGGGGINVDVPEGQTHNINQAIPYTYDQTEGTKYTTFNLNPSAGDAPDLRFGTNLHGWNYDKRYSWIQSVDGNSSSNKRGLALNPDGGEVTVNESPILTVANASSYGRKTIAIKGYTNSLYIDPNLNVYGVGDLSNNELINLTSYDGIPAGTYIDVTAYSMFRLVVVFNDNNNIKPAMQLGPRLVTSLNSGSGFSTHAGSWYRTNASNSGYEGLYNPMSNSLYYGTNSATTGTKQYTIEVNSLEEGGNINRTIETSVVGDTAYPTCGWKGRANYSAGSTPNLYIYFPEAYSTYFLEGIKK